MTRSAVLAPAPWSGGVPVPVTNEPPGAPDGSPSHQNFTDTFP